MAMTSVPGTEFTYGQFRIRTRPGEEFVFYATHIAGEYDPLEIRKGDVVLDAGANIGDFTVQASRKVGPKGHVVAVEPNSRVLPYLEWNLRENACDNTYVFPCGLGRPGSAYLVETPDGGTAGTSTTRSGSGVEVPVRAIDDVLSEVGIVAPDVVKMDIEGAERDALSGFKGLSHVRSLAVELHGTENVHEIPRILKHEFELWYGTSKYILGRSIVHAASHPLDFAMDELKSGFLATSGALRLIRGFGHPIPSIDRSDLAIVYGKHRESTRSIS